MYVLALLCWYVNSHSASVPPLLTDCRFPTPKRCARGTGTARAHPGARPPRARTRGGREAPASDLTALQAVMSVDAERARLEREAEALVTLEDPEVEQRLIDVYERCGPRLGELMW